MARNEADNTARDKRILALAIKGLTCQRIGKSLQIAGETAARVLDRLGFPRRKRNEPNPQNKDRDDQFAAFYRSGYTLHQIGEHFGVHLGTVHQILRNRGIKMRDNAYRTKSQEARDKKIIALYKQGLKPKDIGPKYKLTAIGVIQVLMRRGVPRRKPWEYDKSDRHDWKEIRERVASVAKLYNTGPNTSALDLGKKIGLASGTVRKHLAAMGVEIHNGQWRGGPGLNAAAAAEIKAALVAGKETIKAIGERFGVTSSAITSIARGASWKQVPWPLGKSYGGRSTAKLDDERVKHIKTMLAEEGLGLTAIAKQFGLTTSAIMAIAKNRSWKHLRWPEGKGYVERPRGSAKILTPERVAELKAILVGVTRPTFGELGKQFGIAASGVAAIAAGRAWTHVPWPQGKTYITLGRRPMRRLTLEQATEIKVRLAKGDKTLAEIGEIHGVDGTTVWRIAVGKNWAKAPWPPGGSYTGGPRPPRLETGILNDEPFTRAQARRRGAPKWEEDIPLLPRARKRK